MDANHVFYMDNQENYYQVQQTNDTPLLKEIDSKSFGAAQAIGIGLMILGLAALTFASLVLGGLIFPMISPIILCIITIAGAASLFTGSALLKSGDEDIQPKKMHHEPQPQTYLYTTQ